MRTDRGGWGAHLDLSDLTDAELVEFADGLDGEAARAWFVWLARWVRDNVREVPRTGG